MGHGESGSWNEDKKATPVTTGVLNMKAKNNIAIKENKLISPVSLIPLHISQENPQKIFVTYIFR